MLGHQHCWHTMDGLDTPQEKEACCECGQWRIIDARGKQRAYKPSVKELAEYRQGQQSGEFRDADLQTYGY